MTAEDASIRLQELLDYCDRGVLTISETELRLYEIAAFIDPDKLVAKLPDSIRCELAKIASHPMISREDWIPIEGVSVRPDRMESYLRERKSREDRQYEGFCRLHRYFTQHGTEAA